MEEEKEGSKGAWNPRGGRPKKDEAELKSEWLHIRLTKTEKQALEDEMTEAGYKKINQYAKSKVLSKGSSVSHNPKILFAKLNDLSPQLKKVGTNINQIAKYVNYLDANDIIDPKFIAEYNAAFKEMAEVQRQYAIAIKAYLRSLSDK